MAENYHRAILDFATGLSATSAYFRFRREADRDRRLALIVFAASEPGLGLRFGFGYSTEGFQQFSPVFTNLWAAVEVNAVQTKYDIRRGAIAALKHKEHIP